jgi:glycosyltransferase involved in cell wall biosynthesis
MHQLQEQDMNILLCNERFLFRFGADRVLIIIGKKLKELGHSVSIIANQFDEGIVGTFASNIIKMPLDKDYLNLNEDTASWIKSSWGDYFDRDNSPDIILIGGWPFFSAIPFLNEVCRNVIFMDFGAVPLEGYSGGSLIVQEKLRSLRKRYLEETTLIIGISDFIANSQSKKDANGRVPVRSVLLGADHMGMAMWSADNLNLKKLDSQSVDLINKLKSQGEKIILCLGRWEPNCYKNSDAAYDVFRQIHQKVPNCVLLILADPSNIRIPHDIKEKIFPIGFPDDDELTTIMGKTDLGITVSLWEGFNLPIVEMQWLGRPVMAFNIGAHPEVILHPWYLCSNKDEMASKSCEILLGCGLDSETMKAASEKFHSYFTWDRAIREYNEIFINGASNSNQSISLIIDVTNAAKDPANSGVVRVTRRLSREFQKYLNPIFVVWDQTANCHVLPTKEEFHQLSEFNGPILTDNRMLSQPNMRIALREQLPIICNSNRWLLFTETVNEDRARQIRHYGKSNGIHLAAIFYDAIPVLYPELCKDKSTRDNHRHYMTGLAECDVVIPISKYSADCLKKFWEDNQIKGCTLTPNLLPGEFSGSKRCLKNREYDHQNRIDILCVSTLEPRKNHKKLIESCLLMQTNHPELDWSLTLVGNRYAGAFDIADYAEDISAKNPRIRWLGVVDDAKLHKLYEEATFTVYPSFIEGFGMPILESLWHGCPCICHQEGVMAELAAEGGCLTTNVLDEKALSESIYKLSSDMNLVRKLSQQAVNRNIKLWDEYTQEFISILKSQNPENTRDKKGPISMNHYDWQEVLYPECLCENWQMNHSERLAMTALLSRIMPRCSIEIGTYKGGSLSLISQYSKMVFSIDIDPSIPEKFGYFKNVCFLTGQSSEILPMLLNELNNENISVDFILIDGDHSAEGIKRDIETLLSYVPKKPLFVMMHDSFNPECRRGMLEAKWEKSQYVHWIDIDFIPGRIIEDNGPARGEMWGGLALAYFSPAVRNGAFNFNCSANMMHKIIKDRNQIP